LPLGAAAPAILTAPMSLASVASRSETESFTDTLQANMSSRDSHRTIAYEQVRLCVRPEDPDPEWTPDIPEEMEHYALCRNRDRRSPNFGGAKVPLCSRSCKCAWGWGSFLLVSFVIAILIASGRFGDAGASHLQHQMLRVVPKSWIHAPHPSRPSHAPSMPVSTSSQSLATSTAPFGVTTSRPKYDDLMLSGAICNTTAPFPKPELRSWHLPDAWRRACEKKNVQDKYPLERNWCWIGFNNMCHWNLKAHKSWAEYQDMAASDGFTVPRNTSAFHPLDNPEVCDRQENGKIRAWSEREIYKAREWFKEHVAVYVLSLPTIGDQRWKVIHKRLNDLHIWHTRVPGVDMRFDGALDASKRSGFVPLEWNFTRAQTNAYSRKHGMGSILGTTGCAAAHFKVQQKVIADGAPMALVMEDDSWPTDDFIPRVWNLVRTELPCDWEVTALLSRCGYGRCISPQLMRVMPDANEPAWRCHAGSNWGMHAVLYHTAKLPALQIKWKKTVFNEDRPHCMDVDVALASISDQVAFYAVPAVQDPGYVREMDGHSARWDINQAFETTSTTSISSSPLHPEPWPGAWSMSKE